MKEKRIKILHILKIELKKLKTKLFRKLTRSYDWIIFYKNHMKVSFLYRMIEFKIRVLDTNFQRMILNIEKKQKTMVNKWRNTKT